MVDRSGTNACFEGARAVGVLDGSGGSGVFLLF